VAETADEDAWDDVVDQYLSSLRRKPQDCASSSICASGAGAEDVVAAIEDVTGCVPHLVTAEDDLGIPFEYDPPHALGRDRILACVAAKEEFGTPVIVLDLGTFITCDLVDEEGEMLPIGIAPGVPAMVQGGALCAPHLGDTLTELDEIRGFVPDLPAANTFSSLGNGYCACVLGTVERLIGMADSCRLSSEPAPVVVTGGDADIVVEQCSRELLCVDTLVLDGLRLTDPAMKT